MRGRLRARARLHQANDEAAQWAKNCGFFSIIGHPPINEAKRANSFCTDEWLPPREYIQRNHDIVDACEELIATPYTRWEVLRSGTWATIRYAKKIGRPVHIIYPGGLVEKEG